jgi:hypothetical protein
MPSVIFKKLRDSSNSKRKKKFVNRHTNIGSCLKVVEDRSKSVHSLRVHIFQVRIMKNSDDNNIFVY